MGTRIAPDATSGAVSRNALAENVGHHCAGFACDPVNAERDAGVADGGATLVERRTLIDDHEVATDGVQLSNKLAAANIAS